MATAVKTKYENIRSRYHNFFRPALRILADDRDLVEDLQCRIHSVQVNLCLGSPSAAQFELIDCYDPERHKVRDQLLSMLRPGSSVKISLGYGSDLSAVFTGYIDCVELEFFGEEAPMIRVIAADVCKLMQDNGVRRRIIHAEKHSEAFSEVMKSYKSFCSAKADETEIELKSGLFQEESDYDFVAKRLVGETGNGYEFLVEQGKALFRKFDPDRKPLTELSPKQGIRKLKLGLLYVNRDIQVLGYSPEQGLLSAAETAAASHVNPSASKGTEIVRAPWAAAQEAAGKVARAYGAYLLKHAGCGEITTVGLPILLPGNYIAVKDVDPQVDGIHYMTRVEHVLNDEGYMTASHVL